MVIDTHIRPALFSPICENKERFEKRCDQMNYHLMKPSSIELLKKQYALAGIEKVFLLPSDCSFETGEPDISNDEIEKIVRANSDRLLAAGKKGTVKPLDPSEIVKPAADGEAPAAASAPAAKTTGSEVDLDIMVDE